MNKMSRFFELHAELFLTLSFYKNLPSITTCLRLFLVFYLFQIALTNKSVLGKSNQFDAHNNVNNSKHIGHNTFYLIFLIV